MVKYLCAVFETLLILFGLWWMLTKFPLWYFFDGMTRYSAMQGLLQGKISSMSYSFVGPMFSLPLFFMKSWIEPMKYNVFLFILFILSVYALFHNHIDCGVLRKFFLILIVASMFSDQVKFFGGETFTVVGVGFGVLAISFAPVWVGWIAIVLGVVNTPATLVGLLCLSVKHLWHTKRLLCVLASLVAVVAIMGESWLRRGNPLNGGYGDQKFSTPFVIGLLSIIFSFNKGLLFFVPGMFLPVKQYIFSLGQARTEKLYSAYTLWISFTIGLMLIYSAWWAWDGALFWGPRFFLIASIPASFALAVRLQKPSSSLFANVLTLVVLAWSLCVGLDGALFDLNDLAQFCIIHNYQNGRICQYDPHYSPLYRPIVNHLHLDYNNRIFVVYSLLVFVYLALPLMNTIVRQGITVTYSYLFCKRTKLDEAKQAS